MASSVSVQQVLRGMEHARYALLVRYLMLIKLHVYAHQIVRYFLAAYSHVLIVQLMLNHSLTNSAVNVSLDSQLMGKVFVCLLFLHV